MFVLKTRRDILLNTISTRNGRNKKSALFFSIIFAFILKPLSVKYPRRIITVDYFVMNDGIRRRSGVLKTKISSGLLIRERSFC